MASTAVDVNSARDRNAIGMVSPVSSWVQTHEYVALITVIVALLMWAATGIPLLPVRPWLAVFWPAISYQMFGALGVLFVWRFLARFRRRGRMPVMQVRAVVSRHFGVRRLSCMARYMLSLGVVMTVQTSIKQAIPFANNARYDAALIRIEEWLHFGFNPAWDLTATRVPAWWAIAMDVSYYIWFPLLAVVPAYFLTHRNRKKRDHYLAAFLGIWVVGVLLGMCFPSHGPCYVAPGRFPGPDMPFSDVTQRWLAERFSDTNAIGLVGDGGMTFGCGLMALPSLHVTVCVLYVIFMWGEARWMRWASIAYALMVFLGSLYSGWHYAIDGYVGALIAVAVTWMTAKLPAGQVNGRCLVGDREALLRA